MTTSDVITKLRNAVIADSAIAAIVSNRIYLERLPQKFVLPAMTYLPEFPESDFTLPIQNLSLIFDAWSKNSLQVYDIMDALEVMFGNKTSLNFDGLSIAISRRGTLTMITQTEENIYHATALYSLKYVKN